MNIIEKTVEEKYTRLKREVEKVEGKCDIQKVSVGWRNRARKSWHWQKSDEQRK